MMKTQKIYNIIAISLVYFFLEMTLYRGAKLIGIQEYWISIPFFLYIISKMIRAFWKKDIAKETVIEISNIIAFIIFYWAICSNKLYIFIWKKYSLFSFIVGIVLMSALLINKKSFEDKGKKETVAENYLFNLFYLNTSKTHEIAMLIDNKIMKAIERERTLEKSFKRNISGNVGKKDIITSEIGYASEESSQKRVYENFDVKTTKSIMLRKIYETALHNTKENLLEGDLILFENVELKQRNVDDTVMILNILQDSKIKNQKNEDVEINLNKMMEKMMDDFTIDYTFKYKWKFGDEKEYIIQIPYKSSDNFENGYQHHDLQLGKLSLIGIYRGEVNFSQRESMSSKFLELVEKSINSDNKSEEIGIMKSSRKEEKKDSIPFKFKHNKLSGVISLIDVIAIIQEINIESKMENIE